MKPRHCMWRFVLFIAFLGVLNLPAYGMTIVPNPDQRLLGFSAREDGTRESFILLPERLPDGPVTLISRLVVEDDQSSGVPDSFWLVALTPSSDAIAPELGVVWSKERTWLGLDVWRIKLNGQVDLALLSPKPRHVYRSIVTYSPESGRGAVEIFDETDSVLIYIGTFEANVLLQEAHVMAGVVRVAPDQDSNHALPPAGVHILQLDAFSAYLPLGLSMELVSKSNTPLPRRMYDRSEDVFVRLKTEDAYPSGEFWIWTEHHDTDHVERHGPIPATSGEIDIAVPSLYLPGKIILTVDYVSEGHRWLSDSWELSGGWLRVNFSKVEIDQRTKQAYTTLTLQSDRPLTEVELAITASLRAAVRTGVFKALEVKRFEPIEVFRGRVDMSNGLTTLPVRISLADVFEPGVWEVHFDVSASSSIDLLASDTEQLFMVQSVEYDQLLQQGTLDHLDVGPPMISAEEEQRLRKEAAQRPRRVLFNNDGDDARASTGQTPTDLLQKRSTGLIGSQVDTIIYNTAAGTFGRFSHFTTVGEVLLTREGPFKENFTPHLMLNHGTDPLQVLVDFARTNNFEFFWSMRMNDTHDAGSDLYVSDLKKKHPELMFGTSQNRPPHGNWSGIDYGHPLVRELAYRYVEEVALNYDIDGVLLDFFRHPILFKSVAWGQPLRQEELNDLTGMMRRIRDRLIEIGRARAKPILLAIRVPDSVPYSKAIGIDLEGWLSEGLVDILVPSGYFQLNRWEVSVELGRRYGVPVYPSLDESRVNTMNAPTLEPDRTTIESYRGRATNVWQSGAAGIHIFNISNPRHPMFREIGDPQTLVGKDKVYFMTIRAARSGYGSPSFWVGNVGDIPRMPVLTPGEPGILHRDVPLELNLDVGEDLETARNMGLDPHVILQLVVSRLPSEQALDVHLNDHPLELINASYPTEAYRVETYQVDPTWLRPGSNLISVSLNNSGRSQFLYDLQLQIRY